MFNTEMAYCGVGAGVHKSMDNVILLEYAKGILKEGEMPSINVTITEEVPPELLAKMSKFCCYLSIHLIRNYGNWC